MADRDNEDFRHFEGREDFQPFKKSSPRVNGQAREAIKGGARRWNPWKKRHPRLLPDLAGLDLRGIDLSGVDLSYADLHGCDFRQANLRKSMLADADLSGSNFAEADLSQAKLYESNLCNCKFHEANLSDAVMFWSSLAGADLSYAKLTGADLTGIEDMSEVDMSYAELGWTILGDLDLSAVKGLETVIHEGPSVIGIDTIYASSGKIPKTFLLGAGVPENFIEYMPSLVQQAVGFFSCFISHSTKDKGFCDDLVRALRSAGVRVWYFPEDARWGGSVWGEIDRAIVVYDRLIVVCSENSLQSGPVLREVERALSREDRTGENVLFPIRIDDYLFSGWSHPRKADVISKIVADFRGTNGNQAKYELALRRLVQSLQYPSLKPNP